MDTNQDTHTRAVHGLAGIAAFVLNIGSWRETAGFVLLCLILMYKVMEE